MGLEKAAKANLAKRLHKFNNITDGAKACQVICIIFNATAFLAIFTSNKKNPLITFSALIAVSAAMILTAWIIARAALALSQRTLYNLCSEGESFSQRPKDTLAKAEDSAGNCQLMLSSGQPLSELTNGMQIWHLSQQNKKYSGMVQKLLIIADGNPGEPIATILKENFLQDKKALQKLPCRQVNQSAGVEKTNSGAAINNEQNEVAAIPQRDSAPGANPFDGDDDELGNNPFGSHDEARIDKSDNSLSSLDNARSLPAFSSQSKAY